jgi:hypothetical protein
MLRFPDKTVWSLSMTRVNVTGSLLLDLLS